MPLPNAHSCVVKDAGQFEADAFGKGQKFKTVKSGILNILIGKIRGESKTTTHSYHYPTADWTEDVARKHCQDNDGRFEPAAKE